MKQEEKKQIVERLKEYVAQKGSQNKAATSMNVSSATLSKMLSGDWELISDDMWRNVAAQLGHDSRAWSLARTRASERMMFLLHNAKDDSLTVAVTGDAGCGKTESIRTFARSQRNVYHLCCSEYWNRRTFMAKLLQTMGVDYMGNSVSEMMDEIIDTLKRTERPLVVLDEADKLSDAVLYFFISLYNQLEGSCGIVLCATSYLEKRIRRGIRLKKKGYEEIYSRIGRKFVKLQVVNGEDVEAVCKANGINDTATIRRITEDAECDLRRVKRSVWAELKK